MHMIERKNQISHFFLCKRKEAVFKFALSITEYTEIATVNSGPREKKGFQ